ncbi:tRNA (adenosine(37)-N6)-threonylcarbamoyltransferase complex ATPase subunit type 1 TsaE [Shewanella sp. NIFS-20-20]|uniref:tRNA (adenosine(37)-N6)-threonylcarbamoyltransferase complex ATPase subunit type 1 TsaE n=1 Tax=Shewanella sp. NIFS-20-20 TaxID=2853806 RepID=UPI001C47CF32|nr:tRNA (adenosine(37)-N6)-threonylcarbamoyltransferase complex ATPase subunit type 1 TsaE [Shewanella sp. NIFS-20-20]MBV7316745.1 tRNA (adenosine(37)-N6)-threonylcarbamoyltransferase complex ATPase subunit type 1 TsaE [Shewanella sp. NIFS-20-20]
MVVKHVFLEDETDTVSFGRQLAAIVTPPLTLYLTGDLGAGKTTLSRGIIQSLGHSGAVKSPTYTLVEPYELADMDVYHFDLYRLADPEELEFMGIRDYFSDRSLCIVEWPEQGAGLLPEADLHLHLSYDGQSRQLVIEANSDLGETLIAKL